MPKGYFKPFTEAQEEHIKNEYLNKPVKRLADELNASYGRIMRFLKNNGLEIPKEVIKQRKLDSRKKKGDIPFNKGKKQEEYMSLDAIERTKATRFKKGRLPHNYVNGEHKDKDGYVLKTLGEGKKTLKHRQEWEKRYGKIPDKHILKCKSENIDNCDPSNWELMSMIENMYRNSKHDYPKEIIPSLVLVKNIENQINSIENE